MKRWNKSFQCIPKDSFARSKTWKLYAIGSEAMEVAMKLARQYFLEMKNPQRERIRFIARTESYHGTTLGSLSMGGHKSRRVFYEPMLLKNISHISACHPYRWRHEGETDAAYVERLAQELDDEFRRVGPETVCAFVAEPIVGAVGLFPLISNGSIRCLELTFLGDGLCTCCSRLLPSYETCL